MTSHKQIYPVVDFTLEWVEWKFRGFTSISIQTVFVRQEIQQRISLPGQRSNGLQPNGQKAITSSFPHPASSSEITAASKATTSRAAPDSFSLYIHTVINTTLNLLHNHSSSKHDSPLKTKLYESSDPMLQSVAMGSCFTISWSHFKY